MNYFDGDYKPVSPAAGPDNGVNTTLGTTCRPLYNGNISSMGASISKLNTPFLYNYQYDQLNRLVHMDAWKRTAPSWNALTPTTDYQENVTYDPNGNITAYSRNAFTSGSGNAMDKLHYAYLPNTNQLDHIVDTVPGSVYNDISTQDTLNYKYDAIGELIADNASNITGITWTVYGKIASITKTNDTTIRYTYDASGNRISKSLTHAGQTESTWYVRDAQGNILSTYTNGDPSVNGGSLAQTELDVYGSSRLGIWKRMLDVEGKPVDNASAMRLVDSGYSFNFSRGNKLFELTNHLGNVLAAISDKRYGVSSDDSTVAYYNPEVVSANDYYPFGMMQPGRYYTEAGVGSYRYGFNGKENDNEVKGVGNELDYGERIYDTRSGRFLSVDPLQAKYPNLTPYQFASNSPIAHIDLDGLEKYHYTFTFDKQGDTHIQLSSTEHFSEWQWKPKWGGTSLGFQLYEKVEDPRKEYTVEYSFQDYLVVGVAAEPVTTTYTASFNSDADALNAKWSDFGASVRNVDIAKGAMAGVDMPGLPSARKKGPTPEEGANKQATASHGSTEAAQSNTATSNKGPVQPYEVGEFGDLQKRSVVGDNLDLHHFPQKKPAGQVITGYDAKKGTAMAIPAPQHKKIPTEKGVYTGAPRTLLATDAKKARKAGVPNKTIQEGINHAKKQHPAEYKKT